MIRRHLILCLLSCTLSLQAARRTYSGFFGKTEFITSEEIAKSITEGSVLAFTFTTAFKDEDLYPWESGVHLAITFGQAGKSKASIIPRVLWSSLGEDFSPFLFSLGLGVGPTFLFLKTANYGAFASQFFIATEVDLGAGMALGGESCVELPLTSALENPPSVSVFLKLSYRG